MTQYHFTTNIEHRMHNTGKVYGVDRMTSDYAQAHPLDVEGFIEGVYQEFAGTAYEESRETLHKVWRAVLGCKNPCGDRTLYPNRNGGHRPASMKVWLKAGEYWRMGLRPGDTLPCMAPMHRITRLDNGEWIALFPKDAHLLESEGSEECRVKSEELMENDNESSVIEENTDCTDDETATIDHSPLTIDHSPLTIDHSPFLLRNTTQASHRAERTILSEESEQARADHEPFARPEGTLANARTMNQPRPRRQRKPRKPRVESEPITVSQEPITANCQASGAMKSVLMMLGGVMALSLVLFIVLETGLLIPLGLIGLATGGLLK